MSSRASTLARLRALRQAGKTGFSSYEVQEAEDLYDTVDDEGYKKVVRSRLDEDDFVVDDNGAGYADDGREDWQNDRQGAYDSDSENELPSKGKAGTYASLSLGPNLADKFQLSGNATRMFNSKRRSRTESTSTSAQMLQR